MNPLLKLNNEQLENSLKFYMTKERQILHIVLQHIREMFRRDLHLKRYGSMAEYLVKEFGYSETCARLRISAAKLMGEVPSLAEKIQDGSMNLVKVAELSRAVKEKESEIKEKVSAAQKIELVAMISGKTARESQKELAEALDIKVKDFEFHRVQKDESVRHEFTASKELQEKINRCRGYAAHKISQEHKEHSLASMLEVIMDAYLKSMEGTPQKSELALQAEPEKVNKSITRKTRQQVIQRDQCCQHKDPETGKKCESTFALQADHITPKWANGSNAPSSLQALCANHNQAKYRRESQLKFH